MKELPRDTHIHSIKNSKLKGMYRICVVLCLSLLLALTKELIADDMPKHDEMV
jgi:hypothetical protein